MFVVKRTEQYMDFTKATKYLVETTVAKCCKLYHRPKNKKVLKNNNRIFFNVNNKIKKQNKYN